jgi:hypothetical protein
MGSSVGGGNKLEVLQEAAPPLPPTVGAAKPPGASRGRCGTTAPDAEGATMTYGDQLRRRRLRVLALRPLAPLAPQLQA